MLLLLLQSRRKPGSFMLLLLLMQSSGKPRGLLPTFLDVPLPQPETRRVRVGASTPPSLHTGPQLLDDRGRQGGQGGGQQCRLGGLLLLLKLQVRQHLRGEEGL